MEPPPDTLDLPTRPSSARDARRFVGDALLGRGIDDDTLDTTLLLTSELVTNALVHAGGGITVRVVAAADGVRVEVGDDARQLPVRRDAASQDTSGRGLDLVEHLARRWGVTPVDGDGKTVWFEIAIDLDERVIGAAVDGDEPPSSPR